MAEEPLMLVGMDREGGSCWVKFETQEGEECLACDGMLRGKGNRVLSLSWPSAAKKRDYYPRFSRCRWH